MLGMPLLLLRGGVVAGLARRGSPILWLTCGTVSSAVWSGRDRSARWCRCGDPGKVSYDFWRRTVDISLGSRVDHQ